MTERFGKVRAIARGVRKITAKLAGNLEPFMLVGLELHEGKTFYTVTGAGIIADWPNVHINLGKMADAFYLGELIDKFEWERQRSPEVFALLQEMLATLDRAETSLAMRAFEIKLLHLAGFVGDLFECMHCRKKLCPEENYWDGEEGGIICGRCQSIYHHGSAVSNDLIKLLRLLVEKGFEPIGGIKVSAAVAGEARTVLSIYLKHVLESDLKTEHFRQALEKNPLF